MSGTQLQKEIISQLGHLSKDAMKEVLDFVYLIKKKSRAESGNASLSHKETVHLEEEFKDYKRLFPHE